MVAILNTKWRAHRAGCKINYDTLQMWINPYKKIEQKELEDNLRKGAIFCRIPTKLAKHQNQCQPKKPMRVCLKIKISWNFKKSKRKKYYFWDFDQGKRLKEF